MRALLNGARHEILDLRRQNEILRAKVEAMDIFALVLNTTPNYRSQAMSVDVAWELQKEIDKLEAKESENAHQGHSG